VTINHEIQEEDEQLLTRERDEQPRQHTLGVSVNH
jgi:hypothetical protein